MSGHRPVLMGASGLTAALVGAGYGVVKAIAWSDRRHHFGTEPLDGESEPDRVVDQNLLEPPGTLERTIDADDGARLHLIERGHRNRRPLLLLHGVTLSSRVWHHQLQDLSDDYWVIAPDWRGHGRSVAGKEGYGLGRLARDLATIIEQLDLHDAMVVGHSMGGMALMRYCREHADQLRERVGHLVFQSTAACDVAGGPLSLSSRLFGVLARRRPSVTEWVPVAVPGDLGYVITRFGFGLRPSPVWVEQVRDILDDMSPTAAGKSFVALLEHDERDTLPTVTTPTTVFVGTHDLLTPERQGRQIASLIPGAELRVFEDGGHLLMLERREQFGEILRSYTGPNQRTTSAP